MRHPIAIAALATSTTMLVASLCDARPSMFFLSFGVACFALAGLVQDAESPANFGPMLWTVAGGVQLGAFGTLHDAHPADPTLTILGVLGTSFLLLGTLAWLRARLS